MFFSVIYRCRRNLHGADKLELCNDTNSFNEHIQMCEFCLVLKGGGLYSYSHNANISACEMLGNTAVRDQCYP